MENDTATMAENARVPDAEVDSAPDILHDTETTTPNVQREISTLDAVKYLLIRLRPHAKLARPHVLTLLYGLVFLSTMFMGLSSAYKESSKHIESHLEIARDESFGLFLAYSADLDLDDRLDKVLNTQLSNNSPESYEDCLVRGLQVADQQLLGRAYHGWDTVHKTFDWALVNCGRLHHVPQLSQPTVHHASPKRWAQTTYRARRITEKTRTLITHQITSFQTWLSKHTGARSLKTPEPARTETPRYPRPGSTEHTTRFLSLGFVLKCDKLSSCHLMYTPSVHEPSHKARISSDCIQVAESLAEVTSLRKAYDLRRFKQHLMAWIATSLFGLGLVTSYSYLIFVIWTCDELRHWLISEAPDFLCLAGTQLAAAYLANCEYKSNQGSPRHNDFVLSVVTAVLPLLSAVILGFVGSLHQERANPIKGLCRVSRDALADLRDPEKYPYVLVEGRVILRPTSPTSPAQAPSALASPPVAPTPPPVDPARPLSPLAGLLAALILSLEVMVEYHSFTVHYEPEDGTEAESQVEVWAEPENDPRIEQEVEAALEREVELETQPEVDADDSEWAFVET